MTTDTTTRAEDQPGRQVYVTIEGGRDPISQLRLLLEVCAPDTQAVIEPDQCQPLLDALDAAMRVVAASLVWSDTAPVNDPQGDTEEALAVAVQEWRAFVEAATPPVPSGAGGEGGAT